MCDMFFLEWTLSIACQSWPSDCWATCRAYSTWTDMTDRQTDRKTPPKNIKQQNLATYLYLTNVTWNRCMRMAKGRSVHGSWKKEKWRCVLSLHFSDTVHTVGCGCSCLTCGILHFHFFFVTSARNSKKGLVNEKWGILSLILSVVSKGRRGHGSRGGFLCQLGAWREREGEGVNIWVIWQLMSGLSS